MPHLSSEEINLLRHHARCVVRELGLLNDAYFEIGVTLAERHLLIELSSCECPTHGEVAQRLLIDKSTASRLIAKAVKKGYIRCNRDEKDKRKQFLQLTEKGTHTLNAFEPIAFHQTKEALATLSSQEVELVYQGVALYAKGLKRSRLQNSLPTSNPIDKETPQEIYQQLNQQGYLLKPLSQEEEPGLYEIFREVVDSGCQFPYEDSSLDGFHRQFLASSQVYVCCSSSKEVVGGFYLRANFTGRSAHIANGAYMVKNSHRGQGLGKLLLKASLYLAKEAGFRAMQFNMVLSQNRVAVQLYQKLGFKIIGTLPKAVRNPDGTTQEGYIMHRTLENL
jgi:DNA-binding MarR family transcriptional regulator/GNAT superfamily N-acetyltransferase